MTKATVIVVSRPKRPWFTGLGPLSLVYVSQADWSHPHERDYTFYCEGQNVKWRVDFSFFAI